MDLETCNNHKHSTFWIDTFYSILDDSNCMLENLSQGSILELTKRTQKVGCIGLQSFILFYLFILVLGFHQAFCWRFQISFNDLERKLYKLFRFFIEKWGLFRSQCKAGKYYFVNEFALILIKYRIKVVHPETTDQKGKDCIDWFK